MKNKRYRVMVFLAVIGLMLGSCSRGPAKMRTVPPKQPSPATGENAEGKKPVETPEPKAEDSSNRQPVLPHLEKDDLSGGDDAENEGVLDKEEVSAALEEALSSYQQAQAALDKGEIETAITDLDDAYAFLLRARTPPDSELCQEKNDLRFLIAQRLQQIYASHLKPAVNNNGTIPLLENKWVQDEIRSFQTREKKFFEDSYKRSGLYRPMIVEEFKKAGLPEELSWIPLIESGFKPRALSRARALGMWQFIRSTGYRYGLKQDKYVDERMDPLKATQAAAKYLTELHDFFGDWTTALASYNCGELRVQNVIRAQKIDYLDNFWDLFNNLPYETARFVPRIIAVILIVNNPQKYGFALPPPDPVLAFETVTTGRPVKLASISSGLGLDPLVLSFLNPELRYDSTPDYSYTLKVPAGSGEKVMAALPALPRYTPPEALYGWHIVKRGETIGAIARRYRTSTSAIMRLNGLRDPRRLQIGQRLKIPGKGQAVASDPAVAQSGGDVSYRVREGDTLFAISKRFRTTVERIKSDNGLTGEMLSVGQRLVIRPGKT